MQQGPTPSTTAPRLRWRVVIHAGEKIDPSRGQQSLAWHLAECSSPASLEAHCDVGRRLIAADGNPDGHCLIGGVCPRCEQAAAAEAAKPPPPPAPAPEPAAPAPAEPAPAPPAEQPAAPEPPKAELPTEG
jgi:hypothetical protein